MSDSCSYKWKALALTSKSEGEDPDVLIRAIRGALKQPACEVFIPAAVTQIGEDRVVHYLVGGYAFVRNPGNRLNSLDNTRYVQSVLPGEVPNSDIEKMRSQIEKEVDQGIGVGDTVKIVSGPYRNLTATVIEEIPEEEVVQVYIKLRSKQAILTLPRPFLDVVERTPLSGLFSRLADIKTWVQRARPILQEPLEGAQSVRGAFERYSLLEGWMGRNISLLPRFVVHGLGVSSKAEEAGRALGTTIRDRPGLIRRQWRKTTTLTRWEKQVSVVETLRRFIERGIDRHLLEEVEAKLLELDWLEGIFDQISQLDSELESVAHRLARRRKKGGAKVFQNILVDGHNLACRCLYAPGISGLCDSSGRPTGVVLGFLRTLGSLKKKFPEARLYVAWDGSSQRRKSIYAGYKASRKSASGREVQGFDQIAFLKEILPKLGAWQVFNPEEEADDVLAVMVRGPLKSQHNVIYSTDKDMLSLVTDSTSVLMPGAGTRKEVLHDPDSVERAFGVPPGRLAQLRAFCGDTSDNIPGVPRVPKKILKSLVQSHRTVEGVYRSGLSGLTEGQYERLRLAEPQVRLNLRLISFVDVAVQTLDPDLDLETVSRLLVEIEIKPAPILAQFRGG